jgi:hypothetical protein
MGLPVEEPSVVACPARNSIWAGYAAVKTILQEMQKSGDSPAKFVVFSVQSGTGSANYARSQQHAF